MAHPYNHLGSLKATVILVISLYPKENKRSLAMKHMIDEAVLAVPSWNNLGSCMKKPFEILIELEKL